MGSKICKAGVDDTPLVHFSLNCTKIINSENINIDRIDAPEFEGMQDEIQEDKKCVDKKKEKTCSCFG